MLPKLWRRVEFQGQLLYWRKGVSKTSMTCGSLVIQESSCQALQPLNWNLQLSPVLHAEVDWLGSFFPPHSAWHSPKADQDNFLCVSHIVDVYIMLNSAAMPSVVDIGDGTHDCDASYVDTQGLCR